MKNTNPCEIFNCKIINNLKTCANNKKNHYISPDFYSKDFINELVGKKISEETQLLEKYQ